MAEEFNDNVIKGKMKRAAEKRGLLSGGKPVEGEPQGTGPLNRHGMPQVPPGQRKVPNWPVLDLGVVPDISPDKWTLTVKGEVDNPYTLKWNDFFALPQIKDVFRLPLRDRLEPYG